MDSKTIKYVILVRHASREVRWNLPEAKHFMKNYSSFPPHSISNFKKPGLPLTYAMAGRLCDQLEEDGITVVKIVHSKHKVAEQTAKAFADVLKRRECFDGETCEAGFLTPCRQANGTKGDPRQPTAIENTPGSDELSNEKNTEVNPASTPLGDQPQPTTCIENATSLPKLLENLYKSLSPEERKKEKPAVILVGHQPQLTNIANELLGKRRFLILRRSALPTGTLPIGGSEIACLRCGKKPRLEWLITEKSDSLLRELREKIKSKYDVAKFILGAFIVNTGLILNADIWNSSHPGRIFLNILTILFAFMSLGFTVGTLFSYDSLMMPFEFWSEYRKNNKPPPSWSVRRPPSQGHLVLYYEMVHTWNRFFIPAIITTFFSIYYFVWSLAYDRPINLLCTPQGGISAPRLESLPQFLCSTPLNESPLYLAIIGLVVPILFVWLVTMWYGWKRPRLGFED